MDVLDKQYITGHGKRVTGQFITNLYKDLVRVSIPTSGRIDRLCGKKYGIKANYSAVDCDHLEAIKTTKFFTLEVDNESSKSIKSVESVSIQNSGSNDKSEIMFAASDNGKFLARLKKGTSDKQVLEIWRESSLIKSIDIDEINQHGPIVTGPAFSSFAWSPFENQSKLLYICQEKPPKHQSFFKKGKEGETVNQSKFLKKENWGECLTDVEHTILGVLDLEKDDHFENIISAISIPDASIGVSQWLADGYIVSEAYNEFPKKLGVIYCNNRPSFIIVHSSVSGNILIKLESETFTYHTPRSNNVGDGFIYLKNRKFGPHRHSLTINNYDMRSKAVKEYQEELFISQLPRKCFTTNDGHILLVISQPLTDRLHLFDLQSSTLIPINQPAEAITILDFRDDIILASGSDFNLMPNLQVAILDPSRISSSGGNPHQLWHKLEVSHHYKELTYSSHQIPTEDKQSFITAYYLRPVLNLIPKDNNVAEEEITFDEKQLPTIVLAHGGPHSNITNMYSPNLILYARLGLKVLMINYRGSSGVNQEYLESLNGRVGELDVNDVLQAIRQFSNSNFQLTGTTVSLGTGPSHIDPTKLIISGGSHGGFLAAHLSCQTEFKFSSAIIRNPVIDISTGYQTCDIPDWCLNQALGDKHFDFGSIVTNEQLIKMYQCSPMSKADKAYVPTLMLLGSNDKRVNMYQGERWVDILKARGIETMCKIYEDKHSLDKPETAADSTITAITWILNHLKHE